MGEKHQTHCLSPPGDGWTDGYRSITKKKWKSDSETPLLEPGAKNNGPAVFSDRFVFLTGNILIWLLARRTYIHISSAITK